MGFVLRKPWGNSASKNDQQTVRYPAPLLTAAQLNLDGAIDADEFADAWTKGVDLDFSKTGNLETGETKIKQR